MDTGPAVGDTDFDGVIDIFDNCTLISNFDQTDTDADGEGDACDNCPAVGNPDQANLDGDGLGDVCDPDIEGDGVANAADA